MKKNNLDNINIDFHKEKSGDSGQNKVLSLYSSVNFQNGNFPSFAKDSDSIVIKKIYGTADLGKAMQDSQETDDLFDDIDENNIDFSVSADKNISNDVAEKFSFKSDSDTSKTSIAYLDFSSKKYIRTITDSSLSFSSRSKRLEKFSFQQSSQVIKQDEICSSENPIKRQLSVNQQADTNFDNSEAKNNLQPKINNTNPEKSESSENFQKETSVVNLSYLEPTDNSQTKTIDINTAFFEAKDNFHEESNIQSKKQFPQKIKKKQNPYSDDYCEVKFYDFQKLAVETKENYKKAKIKKKRKIIRNAIISISLFFFIFMLVININIFVQRKNDVYGSSMEPTLHQGDTIYSSMLPYVWGEPEIGDIVIIDISLEKDFRYFHLIGQVLKRNDITSFLFGDDANNIDKCWVKRIVGVAGDVLTFQDDKFYRNGELVVEDYIKEQSVNNYPVDKTITVPEGHVYVMGDNRNVSKDSRDANVGPIPVYQIIGKMRESE